MKVIRNKVFETNSSSTHSLTFNKKENDNFWSPNSELVIHSIDTNDYGIFSTLNEKVSYLVSQIINKYKYGALNYQDLINDVEEDWDFRRIKEYIRNNYNKEVVFPEKYYGDLDDIVLINHQLTDWYDLDDLLRDIYSYDHDFLEEVLSPSSKIVIGRD